jgi:hypothetical protein
VLLVFGSPSMTRCFRKGCVTELFQRPRTVLRPGMLRSALPLGLQYFLFSAPHECLWSHSCFLASTRLPPVGRSNFSLLTVLAMNLVAWFVVMCAIARPGTCSHGVVHDAEASQWSHRIQALWNVLCRSLTNPWTSSKFWRINTLSK